MAQELLTMQMLDVVLRILLIPVVLLLGILLYRVNRIITHGEHSLESVEKTAENVEESTKSLTDILEIFRSLKTGKGDQDDK